MNLKSTLIFSLLLTIYACQEKTGKFVCPPCDLPCDTLTFAKAGICPHCNMKLIVDESTLVLNEVNLSTGSGVFLIEGSNSNPPIKIYYHQPKNFTKDSKVLMAIPGAGRNGNSYRDAWIEESEKYGVLILSPMFKEGDYPFEAYHLGGLIESSNLNRSVQFSDSSNVATLDESTFEFTLNTDPNDWLFNEFDRIFDLVVESTRSNQTTYDLFGHSAGGQILHRLALFSNTTKANHIIAANSGFYTLPDFDTKMPFGMQDMLIDTIALKTAFSKKLTILIGQLDNENETGGTLLRSPTVDQQGNHRLARGRYFYEFSKRKLVI